jgi:hypothetical protein
MSSSTSALAPAATGASDAGNATIPEFTGVPISERAAYLSRIHIGVTSALMFLCLITFSTRMWQRIRPVWKVGLDDYFIVAGFVRLPPP